MDAIPIPNPQFIEISWEKLDNTNQNWDEPFLFFLIIIHADAPFLYISENK